MFGQPQSQSERCREEKNLLALPAIEPWILCRPARSLLLYRLSYPGSSGKIKVLYILIVMIFDTRREGKILNRMLSFQKVNGGSNGKKSVTSPTRNLSVTSWNFSNYNETTSKSPDVKKKKNFWNDVQSIWSGENQAVRRNRFGWQAVRITSQ
jgi:hypothetical protein